jgi:hypothetical protein
MHLVAGDVKMISETALYEELVVEKFKEIDLKLIPANNDRIYGAYGCIFEGRMYLFKCLHDKRLAKTGLLQTMITIAKELNKKLIIFTTIEFNVKGLGIIQADPEWIDMHYYKNNKELRKVLAAVIKKDFQ